MALNNAINLQFPVSVAKGGTGAATFTANTVLLGNGTSAFSSSPAFSADGQLLIGNGSGIPTVSTLTAGAGITVTNGSGTITIAATADFFDWSVVSGTTQAVVANNGYISGNAGLVTYTLPSSAALGDTFAVTTRGAGGWLVAQNAGQSMRLGTSVTTTGTGGSFASSALGDSVTMVCIDATPGAEVFQAVQAPVGNITIV